MVLTKIRKKVKRVFKPRTPKSRNVISPSYFKTPLRKKIKRKIKGVKRRLGFDVSSNSYVTPRINHKRKNIQFGDFNGNPLKSNSVKSTNLKSSPRKTSPHEEWDSINLSSPLRYPIKRTPFSRKKTISKKQPKTSTYNENTNYNENENEVPLFFKYANMYKEVQYEKAKQHLERQRKASARRREEKKILENELNKSTKRKASARIRKEKEILENELNKSTKRKESARRRKEKEILENTIYNSNIRQLREAEKEENEAILKFIKSRGLSR